MKRFRWAIIALILLAAICDAGMAGASEMTEVVKSTIDRALSILNDRALEGKAHLAERRARLNSAIDEAIDFKEMTRRSLGIHWRDKTASERSEFVGLFSTLLKDSYMERIEENSDARVSYRDEKINKKRTRGLVRTGV